MKLLSIATCIVSWCSAGVAGMDAKGGYRMVAHQPDDHEDPSVCAFAKSAGMEFLFEIPNGAWVTVSEETSGRYRVIWDSEPASVNSSDFLAKRPSTRPEGHFIKQGWANVTNFYLKKMVAHHHEGDHQDVEAYDAEAGYPFSIPDGEEVYILKESGPQSYAVRYSVSGKSDYCSGLADRRNFKPINEHFLAVAGSEPGPDLAPAAAAAVAVAKDEADQAAKSQIPEHILQKAREQGHDGIILDQKRREEFDEIMKKLFSGLALDDLKDDGGKFTSFTYYSPDRKFPYYDLDGVNFEPVDGVDSEAKKTYKTKAKAARDQVLELLGNDLVKLLFPNLPAANQTMGFLKENNIKIVPELRIEDKMTMEKTDQTDISRYLWWHNDDDADGRALIKWKGMQTVFRVMAPKKGDDESATFSSQFVTDFDLYTTATSRWDGSPLETKTKRRPSEYGRYFLNHEMPNWINHGVPPPKINQLPPGIEVGRNGGYSTWSKKESESGEVQAWPYREEVDDEVRVMWIFDVTCLDQ